MADNPFVVKGDEWGFCAKYYVRCNNASESGKCFVRECTEFPEKEVKGSDLEVNKISGN